MEVIEGAKNLSSTLFPALEAFCEVKDLIYIAIGVGPGSYMGIRTGATIAKTLSFALGIPLIEFASPIAFLPEGKEGSFAFIGDAKMGELYLLTGVARNSEIQDLSPPLLIAPEALNAHIGEKDFVFGVGRLSLDANLNWVAHEVHTRYIQKKFSASNALELTYLR